MINFNEAFFTGKELENVAEAIANKNLVGDGHFSSLCQEFIEKKFGVKKVLLTHSCTAALEMSALMLNLSPDDEVIIPSYTFCSTASAFLRTGAKIIFCEIDAETMMMDPADVEQKISPKTKAIVPVHYGGYGCELSKITTLARLNGIDLIEDAAQAVGAKIDDKSLGTYGRFGCISFHQTKNLHAGLAGALYINDEEDVERATFIWERGTNRQQKLKGLVDKYTWVEVGSSFYPTELQSAFLYSQLSMFESNQAKRLKLQDAYQKSLLDLKRSGHLSFFAGNENYQSNGHAQVIILNSREDCDALRKFLLKNGITSFIGYVPLHSSPVGLKLGFRPEDLPVTEEMALRVLRLPMHHNLVRQDIERVCLTIERFFGRGR